MLPVSGAEQLNISGAIALRPIVSHRGAYSRFVKPAPPASFGRNRFHRPAARALGFNSSMTRDGCQRFRWISCSKRLSFGYTCSSMNARSRCSKSFVRALNSKSMARLIAGEGRWALLQIMRDAFLEILAIEAQKHLALGSLERFLERLEHRFIHLPFDHPHRTRADVRGQVPRVLTDPIEKSLMRKHAIRQSHVRRFGGVDRSRRKQKVECVRMTHDAREHPGHAVFRNQSSTRECRTEPRRFGCEPQVAIESNDQPEPDHRAVNRSDHRFFRREKIRILCLEVRANSLVLLFALVVALVVEGSLPYRVGHALRGHCAKK